MGDVPLILVVGGDALAVRIGEELCSTEGDRGAAGWRLDHGRAKQLERVNREYLPFAPNDDEAPRAVGVARATSLMAVGDDDRMNRQIALGARAVRRLDVRPVPRGARRPFAFPGRIRFGEDHDVGERPQGEVPRPLVADHCRALGGRRDAAFRHIDAFEEIEPFDRLLFIVPLSQFRSGPARREPPPRPAAKAPFVYLGDSDARSRSEAAGRRRRR